MRELRNRPIAAKRCNTRTGKRKEKADLQSLSNAPRTGDRNPASFQATPILSLPAGVHKNHIVLRTLEPLA
jgi:hypothetical protein